MNTINQCMVPSNNCVYMYYNSELFVHSESSTCWGSSTAVPIQAQSREVTKQQQSTFLHLPASGVACVRGCVWVWTLVSCPRGSEKVRTGQTGNLLSVMMISDRLCRSKLRQKEGAFKSLRIHINQSSLVCVVFAHAWKWKERFRVTGENPVLSYYVNLTDNPLQSVWKRRHIQTTLPIVQIEAVHLRQHDICSWPDKYALYQQLQKKSHMVSLTCQL